MTYAAMHGRAFALLLMAAALLTSGARAESQLQGTWLAESAKEAGVDTPEIIGHRLSFDGDRFRITKDGKLLYGGTFTVDPSANPSSIMFDQNETQSLAGVWRGIYALTGDTLTVCDNAPDRSMPRPTGFAECIAPGYVVIRFKRSRSGFDPSSR